MYNENYATYAPVFAITHSRATRIIVGILFHIYNGIFYKSGRRPEIIYQSGK